MAQTVVPGLERRLKAHLLGEVQFDAFTRGRYATDASHYQIMPLGVVAPRSVKEAEYALALAREEGVSVLPRGAGTSQAGQAVNTSLVIDCSKYLDHLIELDVAGRRCVVEPGLVLDELNRRLKPHGLWFPVDISTSSRATIGGMVGNNSCGARSLRYGNTRENVLSIDAVLADGSVAHFGPAARDLSDLPPASSLRPLARDLLALAAREADEIEARFPKLQRRVGGYNLDALHIVKLGPTAVELIDRTMLGLAREIAMFRPTIDSVVRGDPEAVLFVEFAEDDQYHNLRRLMQLRDLMGDLGLGWNKTGAKWGGVLEVFDPKLQAAITETRTAGLNIMMSMKEEGKPVSFVEDCAVPLSRLAEYTSKLTDIFAKHGTRGTWYAHASVGCLHVRPVLNLRLEHDVEAMRAIAEEAFDLVRAYKGSHSGEHGDGIVRSEFHERMFGERLVRAFEQVKEWFDPKGLYNPGKIVRAPKFDDRRVFRYGPDYRGENIRTHLDWSAYPGAGGGFQGAVEMCNNNGACRATAGGVMCPSYRVTRDERDLTRGRANTLRLAITGQLGADALTSDEMAETMKLCVSCKACRRECPTGVDMARMKIEVQAARLAKRGLSLHDRVIGYLPRYAPLAAKWPRLANLRNDVARLRQWSERYAGLSARRSLPRWRPDAWHEPTRFSSAPQAGSVVFFADTFNRYFEPQNIDAALAVLAAGGYTVHLPQPADGDSRPLCCGRTFLAVGLIDEARREAERCVAALAPFLERATPFVGLEPSCMLGFRDEIPSLVKREDARRLAANALLFEEFLAREAKAGTLKLALAPVAKRALLHGHCHQKAFAAMGAVEAVLRLVPDLALETVDSSCCGMAGAFGYGADTFDVSLKMAELSLLPAVRKAEADTLILADGTSCRHQIKDGTGREALHVARVLAMSVEGR